MIMVHLVKGGDRMVKFKEFSTKEDRDLDEQLTSFVNDRNIKIIDIKYQVFLDTSWDIIMSFALLQYEDLSEKGE